MCLTSTAATEVTEKDETTTEDPENDGLESAILIPIVVTVSLLIGVMVLIIIAYFMCCSKKKENNVQQEDFEVNTLYVMSVKMND